MSFGIICNSCRECQPYEGSGELPGGWYAVDIGKTRDSSEFDMMAVFTVHYRPPERPIFCSLKCLATWALLSQVVEA